MIGSITMVVGALLQGFAQHGKFALPPKNSKY
jgi:hypothetical protein